MLKKTIKYSLILVYFNVVYNLLYAADVINITTPTVGDYVLQEGDTLNISNNGFINGKITTSPGAQNFINITTNYNTYRENSGYGSTYFGESTNALHQINIEGTLENPVSFYISNEFYADNLNLDNANLTINNNNISIGRIIDKAGSNTNIYLNNDFGSGTIFGSSSFSITSLTVNNGVTFNLDNNAYIDDILLSDASIVNINDGSTVYGAISSTTNGTGTININNTSINLSYITIGKSENSIGTVNFNGIETSLNKAIYANSINLDNARLDFNYGAAAIGTVSGTGIININTNYITNGGEITDGYNTIFGTASNHLETIRIEDSNLLLGNVAYIDNIYMVGSGTGNSPSLYIFSNAGVNGTISAKTNNFGLIDLVRNYNTLDQTSSDYFNTTFGQEGHSLNTLNIKGTNTLTLGNMAYINNIILSEADSTLNLAGTSSGVSGSIIGYGSVNILNNYSTEINANNTTNFGTNESTKLNLLNIGQDANGLIPEIQSSLTLNNTAYVNTINIANNSSLTIGENGSVNGAIQGSQDNQGTVTINKSYNTATENTVFGTANNRLKQVNIVNNNSANNFTLTNAAYIDNLQINANSISYTDTTRLLTMASGSQLNGSITLNASNNDVLIGISLDNKNINELSNLLTLVGSENSGTASVSQGNELFLNLVDRNQLTDGQRILIGSGQDYSNAGFIYDGIFLDLKLDTSTANSLYLNVNGVRTPTLQNVSQATLTSANIIDKWNFNTKSVDENNLTHSLQIIENNNEFFHALQNLTPDVSGLNVKIPTQSIVNAVANIDKRLRFLRISKINETTNYFSDNLLKNMLPYHDEYIKKRNIWWELFGGTLHQDTKDNIFGYDANYYGLTLGYDFKVNTNFVFGASYTFNFVDANDLDTIKSDRDDLEAFTNNIDLYMMLYNKRNYLTLNVGAGYNRYQQERKINFSNFDRTAKANYNGFSYHAGVEYGINFMLYNKKDSMEKLKVINQKTGKIDTVEQVNQRLNYYNDGDYNSFLMLTPKVSLTYNTIMIDDYTEKGADAANLAIKTKDYTTIDLNGGLELIYNKPINFYTNFQTILDGFVSYALDNKKIELDARYIDDDQVFKVYGFDMPDLTYNVGLTFNFNFYRQFSIGLNYNYTFAEDFDGQMVKLSVLYNF